MKLLLIKIGKALHTLKREGLRRGGKRVLKAFLALFRRVPPGDILFITGGVGDSARYRTEHVAEELGFQGLRCSITVQDNPFLISYTNKFSVFVFHRVLYTPRVVAMIERIKTLGREIVFETDDLVYDPVFLQHMDYYTKMNALERRLYENGVGGEILNDPYVKVCTASTEFLANKLRGRGKQVFVIRNKVSQADVKIADEILCTVTKAPNVIRVAYLSGTPSHNKDFATITDALATLLQQYPQMRLVLVGPLDIESRLTTFASQIEQIPFLPRKQYFEKVAQMDINLAPLEIGNPFCEAKSELKWFEAGLLGVPTVAAATGTFKEAINDGIDGYVAATTEEWVEKIGKLITDTGERHRMGEAVRAKVLREYTTESGGSKDYYKYLRERI